MPYDHQAIALDVQSRLRALGLRPDHLMRMGAFITVYGMFETTLERALWTLREESIEGIRPFTEKMNTEAQFKLLGEGSSKLSDKCNAILKVAAHAAGDLNEYRNSLVHGYMISFGPDSVPSFMKNPGWHGEVRNKSVGDAYIDEPIQNLVLIAAWNLFLLVRKVERVFTDHTAQQAIEAMKEDIYHARDNANEARHLRALMNHEKY